MSTTGYSISKTSFLKLEQCHKAFFFYKNFPYLKDKVPVDRQLTFKRGHEVGDYARQLFPGGTDVSALMQNAVHGAELTSGLISQGTEVIYEATFLFNGVLIMVDILHYSEGKYRAYEVKSSVRTSDIYLKDACLQYYVLKNTLPGFEDLFLATLDPEYVRAEALDVRKLFRRRSVKQKAEENLPYFEHQVQVAHRLLEQNSIPNIAIGTHCFKPYPCDYLGNCWKEALSSEQSIFHLPYINRLRLFEWHTRGIQTIAQLSGELSEEPRLLELTHSFLDKAPLIRHKAIAAFLSEIREPVAAMDMEIWNPAIPQLPGTRPFEQIPFLVCFHDGQSTSHFFTTHETDDRRIFAEELIRLASGFETLLVYDKNMELGVINQLIRAYPDLAPGLEGVRRKMSDVFLVFQNMDYYDPAFRNNFSLKTVSSLLLKDIHYSRIASGLEAMHVFEQLRRSDNPLEQQLMIQDLVGYCGTDTMATYQLSNFLRDLRA